jgi:hypothetical protein
MLKMCYDFHIRLIERLISICVGEACRAMQRDLPTNYANERESSGQMNGLLFIRVNWHDSRATLRLWRMGG